MASLADIAKATGAKPRSVQLWADAGVLVADAGTDREGSGKHRRFSKDEAAIACIIAPFAAEKVAIGGLRAIAKAVRALQTGSIFRKVFEAAFEDAPKQFVVVRTAPATSFVKVMTGDLQFSGPEFTDFLATGTKGGAKISILCLNEVFRPLRAIED